METKWLRVAVCLCLCSAAVLALGGGREVQAVAWIEQQQLAASDGELSDWFGEHVAISGDYAIVGAYADDDCGTSSGSAYVYEKIGGTWMQVDKLLPSDGAEKDYFCTVAISGTTAMVGAEGKDDCGTNSGCVYVFERIGGTWMEVQKLLADDASSPDYFGYAVSMRDTTAVIGAPGDNEIGSGVGSAYLFEKQGGVWAQTQKLTASDPELYDDFGSSVATDGTRAIVGAYRSDPLGSQSGSAYVFEKQGGTWSQTGKLLASNGQANDFFGLGVGIDGTTAVVGARYNDNVGYSAGSAYVYREIDGVWTEVQVLHAADTDEFDSFGWSVAIDGSRIVVGAESADNDLGGSMGRAYVFEDNGTAWLEVASLLGSGCFTGGRFGTAVDLDGDVVIVGDDEGDFSYKGPGHAYIFTPIPEPATMSLVVLGAGALGLARRRRT